MKIKLLKNIKLNNSINKGFTLIEMLVVISLVGILAALSLVSFTSAQKQARDTVRKSDLKQYQNALEAYANISTGLYPEYATSNVQASNTLCNVLNTKLEPDIACSEDPKYESDDTLYYKYRSSGTSGTGTATAASYVIWAKLENISTTTYWVVCSTGKTGLTTDTPASGTCPTLN